MKHLIETTDSSSLATVPYDRIVLDSTENDVIVKGGGYEYVDLGLPSGLKWAKCNVGAEKETDYGYYFQWGDTVDKSNADCSWATYKHWNSTDSTLKKYNTDSSYGAVDNKTTLDPEDDAARANMGGNWRMPTEADLKEMIHNTSIGWYYDFNGSGVSGWIFMSRTDTSKYIFIPAAGYHSDSSHDQNISVNIWTSSLDVSQSSEAQCLNADSEDWYILSDLRYRGHSVRGVFK